MPSRAEVFLRCAPLDVDDVGHKLQVKWVNAAPVSAQMVQFQLTRDLSPQKLVGDSMRDLLAPIQLEASVAIPVNVCLPLPAGIQSRDSNF